MSVRLEHVTKTFDGTAAVDDVSFEAADGELVAVLGPSGCGKTTALRIIAGLEKQDEGTVHIDGEQMDHIPPQNRNVGFVFQTYSLFRYMTVLDNVDFGLKIRKVSKTKRRKKAEELLGLVGLAGFETKLPHMLSGGQRQRVSLARALAYGPSTLLLDEPFGALDAKIRKRLAADLKRIQRELKITTIFVTHDQSEAFELGDRIIIMNRGKIEQIGTPEHIYDRPETRFVASFVGMVNVIDGIVRDEKVQVGPLRLDLEAERNARPHSEGDRVAVLVRPEDVEITRDRRKGFYKGTIRDIRFLGSFVDCDVQCQHVLIKAVETKRNLLQQNHKIGDEVWVRLKSSTIFGLTEDTEKVKERLKTLGYIE